MSSSTTPRPKITATASQTCCSTTTSCRSRPAIAGYTGAWTLDLLVEATPGSIDLATHPITTAAQVRAGLAAGTVGVVTLGLGLLQA